MLGENWLIFALEPKLELDAETLILHSGPKFLCFVVHFYKYFWFWYQTKIVSEKVYAVIWPILEMTSLNLFIFFSSCESSDSHFASLQNLLLPSNHHLSEKILRVIFTLSTLWTLWPFPFHLSCSFFSVAVKVLTHTLLLCMI